MNPLLPPSEVSGTSSGGDRSGTLSPASSHGLLLSSLSDAGGLDAPPGAVAVNRHQSGPKRAMVAQQHTRNVYQSLRVFLHSDHEPVLIPLSTVAAFWADMFGLKPETVSKTLLGFVMIDLLRLKRFVRQQPLSRGGDNTHSHPIEIDTEDIVIDDVPRILGLPDDVLVPPADAFDEDSSEWDPSALVPHFVAEKAVEEASQEAVINSSAPQDVLTMLEQQEMEYDISTAIRNYKLKIERLEEGQISQDMGFFSLRKAHGSLSSAAPSSYSLAKRESVASHPSGRVTQQNSLAPLRPASTHLAAHSGVNFATPNSVSVTPAASYLGEALFTARSSDAGDEQLSETDRAEREKDNLVFVQIQPGPPSAATLIALNSTRGWALQPFSSTSRAVTSPLKAVAPSESLQYEVKLHRAVVRTLLQAGPYRLQERRLGDGEVVPHHVTSEASSKVNSLPSIQLFGRDRPTLLPNRYAIQWFEHHVAEATPSARRMAELSTYQLSEEDLQRWEERFASVCRPTLHWRLARVMLNNPVFVIAFAEEFTDVYAMGQPVANVKTPGKDEGPAIPAFSAQTSEAEPKNSSPTSVAIMAPSTSVAEEISENEKKNDGARKPSAATDFLSFFSGKSSAAQHACGLTTDPSKSATFESSASRALSRRARSKASASRRGQSEFERLDEQDLGDRPQATFSVALDGEDQLLTTIVIEDSRYSMAEALPASRSHSRIERSASQPLSHEQRTSGADVQGLPRVDDSSKPVEEPLQLALPTQVGVFAAAVEAAFKHLSTFDDLVVWAVAPISDADELDATVRGTKGRKDVLRRDLGRLVLNACIDIPACLAAFQSKLHVTSAAVINGLEELSSCMDAEFVHPTTSLHKVVIMLSGASTVDVAIGRTQLVETIRKAVGELRTLLPLYLDVSGRTEVNTSWEEVGDVECKAVDRELAELLFRLTASITRASVHAFPEVVRSDAERLLWNELDGLLTKTMRTLARSQDGIRRVLCRYLLAQLDTAEEQMRAVRFTAPTRDLQLLLTSVLMAGVGALLLRWRTPTDWTPGDVGELREDEALRRSAENKRCETLRYILHGGGHCFTRFPPSIRDVIVELSELLATDVVGDVDFPEANVLVAVLVKYFYHDDGRGIQHEPNDEHRPQRPSLTRTARQRLALVRSECDPPVDVLVSNVINRGIEKSTEIAVSFARVCSCSRPNDVSSPFSAIREMLVKKWALAHEAQGRLESAGDDAGLHSMLVTKDRCGIALCFMLSRASKNLARELAELLPVLQHLRFRVETLSVGREELQLLTLAVLVAVQDLGKSADVSGLLEDTGSSFAAQRQFCLGALQLILAHVRQPTGGRGYTLGRG